MTDEAKGATPRPEVTAEQALGVALSVQAETMTMGEAQERAPAMLEHLRALGYDLCDDRLLRVEAAARSIVDEMERDPGMHGPDEHGIANILRAALAANPAPAGLDEPDPERTGMPKCTCGDIAYQPDPVAGRQQPWRCGGCHRTLSRCDCASAAEETP